jgi:glucose-1-phosphate thymidylyltransferase
MFAELDTVSEVSRTIVVSNGLYYGQLDRWVARHRGGTETSVIDNGTASPDERLGAVGDIAFAIRVAAIDEDVFVAASDCLFTFPLKGLFDRFDRRRGNWVVVREEADRTVLREGATVILDESGFVAHLEEKPDQPRSNLGVLPFYIYTRETLPLIDKFLDENQCADSPGRFPEWLYKRRAISAYVLSSEFECHDLGTIASYEEMCSAFGGLAGGQ